MSEAVDFLIVGGGLSGTILQLELESRGLNSLLIDYSQGATSSKVAAGIVNPITGRFFALTWRAEDIFENLHQYYDETCKKLDVQCFYPMPIQRAFSNIGDQNTWITKSLEAPFPDYCHYSPDVFPDSIKTCGSLMIKKGGFLDTIQFLEAGHKHFRNKDSIVHRQVKIEDIDLENNKYQNISFKSIIFAEGHEGVNNPLFNFLPYTLNKGELIEIKSTCLPTDRIIIGAVFITPQQKGTYKVGATYDTKDLSLGTSEVKKENLTQRLDRTISSKYEIVAHQFGIRPAIKDRRPILGRHPAHENVFIFNGMGSKAVSIAPLLAQELVDFMVHDKALHPECNITRFC